MDGSKDVKTGSRQAQGRCPADRPCTEPKTRAKYGEKIKTNWGIPVTSVTEKRKTDTAKERQ
jgi:hypothetical protein